MAVCVSQRRQERCEFAVRQTQGRERENAPRTIAASVGHGSILRILYPVRRFLAGAVETATASTVGLCSGTGAGAEDSAEEPSTSMFPTKSYD
jgi:hypothetical protein